MRALRLTIKEPGTLLSRLMEQDITAEQMVMIDRIVNDFDHWVLINKDAFLGAQQRRIGFTSPAEEAPRAQG